MTSCFTDWISKLLYCTVSLVSRMGFISFVPVPLSPQPILGLLFCVGLSLSDGCTVSFMRPANIMQTSEGLPSPVPIPATALFSCHHLSTREPSISLGCLCCFGSSTYLPYLSTDPCMDHAHCTLQYPVPGAQVPNCAWPDAAQVLLGRCLRSS